MSRLSRAVSLRYEAMRREGSRRRADETAGVAFHEIGHLLVKLSVEHAHAVPTWRGFPNSCGRCGRVPRWPQPTAVSA
jgi:hypothetical protein